MSRATNSTRTWALVGIGTAWYGLGALAGHGVSLVVTGTLGVIIGFASSRVADRWIDE